MLLYFVRHGQTDWNLLKRFQSRTDIPLNSTGVLQAQCLRKLLDNRGATFVRVFTSPLQRAHETARIIGAGKNVEIVVEPAFRELDLGDYEGQQEQNLRRMLGSEYDVWRNDCFQQAAPAGESIYDVIERVKRPLTELLVDAEGDLVIVGHQVVNATMKAILSGKSDPASLRTYMQGNDEIDAWSPSAEVLVERIKLPA